MRVFDRRNAKATPKELDKEAKSNYIIL